MTNNLLSILFLRWRFHCSWHFNINCVDQFHEPLTVIIMMFSSSSYFFSSFGSSLALFKEITRLNDENKCKCFCVRSRIRGKHSEERSMSISRTSIEFVYFLQDNVNFVTWASPVPFNRAGGGGAVALSRGWAATYSSRASLTSPAWHTYFSLLHLFISLFLFYFSLSLSLLKPSVAVFALNQPFALTNSTTTTNSPWEATI